MRLVKLLALIGGLVYAAAAAGVMLVVLPDGPALYFTIPMPAAIGGYCAGKAGSIVGMGWN